MAKYETLLPRFLRYVKVNTRSNPNSSTVPTDPKEVEFLKTLAKELEEVGVVDVHTQPSSGYVVGTLPANDDGNTPVIGYISHVDTADFNAENIQPQVHKNYDGESDIDLSGDGKWVLKPSVFPSLKKYAGHDLVTTDGLTLLGADDKSGVADIMTMLDYYKEHPEVKHGEIRIGFAPDEETGTGADHFDAKDFNTKYAYTVDGGPLGELEYETFNAAQATIEIQGNEVHTAVAKGLMVNALQVGIDYHNQLPEHDRPEETEDREGFYHLFKMTGIPDHAQLVYIIRDHDRQKFEERKQTMKDIAEKMNAEFGEDRVNVEVHDQYYNMREILEKDMTPVNIAKKAMENLDIKPDIYPVRGGTDGSKISFMGIPTPNLFAGGENMHSRYEYVSVQTMERAVDLLLEINRINTEENN
ncbi:peptidase T [Pediococcus acidilactici]|uniref:peptidase T n=1 Tax=Pediococcus acidilactici TaxID=1254 RepID=UPI000BEEE439|nr:peptidase T [Pediococcus acidilactici]MCQ0050863.1 peptidase T [Pediococcus acidilactici]MCQ0052712.1 peptidase T [Pediococcus acidilactici]MCQ0055238.1 peptidase T [Pediococcus acidilactici]MCQ0060504.1 peptidase T [Pediococcus acidilactici]MCQ0068317.1 peptidase T [Pediococcus acidilactici]